MYKEGGALPGNTGWMAARIFPLLVQRDVENRASAARLVEYSKLKDEISNRSTLQSAIMTLNIAALGTLGGFVLGRQQSYLLLLLLIPLSTALGLWWLNHAQTIDKIGDYIRHDLWPSIIEWPQLEGRRASYEEIVPTTSLLDRSTLFVPFFFVFIGPSFISIGVVVILHEVRHGWPWVFWVGDLVITLFLLGVWLNYLISAGRSRGKGDSR